MEEGILIVDDAMFMRRIMRNALAAGGYTNLAEAKDGDEAIRLCRSYKPRLVFLDITMPGRSGVEVLSEILNENPQMKIVMCSAIGQEETIKKAIRLGAADYLVKPFQGEELVGMAKKFI